MLTSNRLTKMAIVSARRVEKTILLHVHDAYRSGADNLGAGCFRLLPAVDFLRGADGELRALLCRGELQPEIGGDVYKRQLHP